MSKVDYVLSRILGKDHDRTAPVPFRRAVSHGFSTAAALVAALCFLSPPAAAYFAGSGGFSDGSDFALLAFDAATTTITGPSLRFPTNATFTSGSIVVAGQRSQLNTTFEETTIGDFASNGGLDGTALLADKVVLQSGSQPRRLDSTNAFGNATLAGTQVVTSDLVLSGGMSGLFVTENLTAPRPGWGHLLVSADVPSGCSLQFSLLSPSGAVLVASQDTAAPIDLDAVATPHLRVQGDLSCLSPTNSPAIHWLSFGQRAGDDLLGAAVARSTTNLTASGQNYTLPFLPISFTRNPTSPWITTVPSTYHSTRIEDTNFLLVNGTWHMFATVSNATIHRIGHATSSDFISWTWDGQISVGPGSGYDAYQVDHPFVMANATGAGYLMYYSAWQSSTQMRAAVATSFDLVNWTKYGGNPVVPSSASGWDSWNTGNPIVAYEGGAWKMWYSGSAASGGGGNALGYATSVNGFAWTKFAGNPVLDRGGLAAIDQDDLQLKALRSWGGNYHAYFACFLPGTYRICYANSTDGTTWTKYQSAVLAPVGAGWESGHIWPGDIVVQGNHMMLIYAGCAAACSATATGRADADYAPGVVSTTLDFGVRVAHALNSAALMVARPALSTANFYIAASNDGLAWTAAENLSTTGAIAATPALRFVRVTAYINGSPANGAPVYRGLTLDYSSYFATGRYTSDAVAFGEQVSGAKVDLIMAGGAGTVVAETSNDGGATWTRVLNDTFTPMSLSGNSFQYALTLEGNESRTPVVDSVQVVVERTGYPEGVTVRLGSLGPVVYNVSGALNLSANVSLPALEVNLLLDQGRLASPGAATLDFPFTVTSSHFGVVELREPRATFLYKNPLRASFAPAGSTVNTAENATASFSVAYSSFPPQAAVNVSWSFDGVEVTTARGASTFDHAFDFESAGAHRVGCTVENGDFSFNASWVVNVDNVNRAPSLGVFGPSSPASVRHSGNLTFNAQGADLDRDPITYAWTRDGAAVGANASSITLGNLSVGFHWVNLTVSDGAATTSMSWYVNSTNAAPALANRSPAFSPTIAPPGSQVFSVEASDGDADGLAFEWRLDNAFVGSGRNYTFTPTAAQAGSHDVVVLVSDGNSTSQSAWTVTVAPPASPPVTGGSEGLLLVVVVVVAAAAAATALVLMRKRKPRP